MRAAETLRSRHPELDVTGLPTGKIERGSDGWSLDTELVQRIQEAHPTVLLVALGHGKQETWIRDHLDRFPTVRIAMGVGGVFDVLSGDIPRAPQPMRRYGFEWLWRLVQQPSRIGRILRAVFVFPAVVIWDRLRPL